MLHVLSFLLVVFTLPPGFNLKAQTFEAEDYTDVNTCQITTEFGGFSGTGYADYGGAGSYIEWNNVDMSSTGIYNITVRYANGSSGNRAAEVNINGSNVASNDFAPTGGWDSWGTVVISGVSMNSGSNTVRITSPGNGPNIDNIEVDGPSSEEFLTVTPSSLSFGSIAGTQDLEVTSNTSWTVSESVNWLTVSATSGIDNGSITVSVDANTNSSGRTADIVISGSVEEQSVSIYQAAESTGEYANDKSPFGMNLDGINPYDNQWVFVNLVHHGNKWSYLGAASCWEENMNDSQIDEFGYLVGGQTGKMAVIWDQLLDVSGDYVCTYEGTGTIEVGTGTGGDGTDLSVTSSTPGRIEFNLHQKSKYFLILKVTENSTDDPIRNVKIFEKRFDGVDQTFYPEFLEDWKSFKVLRYMDWMGTNHSQVKTWEDYPKDNYLIQSRVSFNYMIELANTLNAHAWFCVPLQADDNFVSQMIDKVSTGLNDNLTAYIELSNEVWNGMFSQHKEAAQLARDLGISNLNRDWEDAPAYYGYRSAQIHNIIDNQWPSTGPDVYRMIAWQQGNTYHINSFLMPEFQQERNSTDVPDGLAIAPYFGHQLGSEANQNIVAGWSVDKLLDQVEFDSHRSEVTGAKLSISDVHEVLQNSISVVNEWNIPELITYEGGQHLSPVGSAANNQAVVDLLVEANRHPRMKDIYIKYHNICKEEGVKLFTVFASCSGYGKYGSWGVKEYGYQTRSEAPKYDGLLTWIGNNTVTWNGKYFTWDDGTKSAKAKTVFEDTRDRSFMVYPNPVKGDAFTVQVPQSGVVTITDLSGKVMFRETAMTNTLEVPVNNYRSGLYLITIQYDDKIESQKLIIE